MNLGDLWTNSADPAGIPKQPVMPERPESTGGTRVTGADGAGSGLMNREFLYDGVSEQLACQLRDPLRSPGACRVGQFELEPLPLTDSDYLTEAKPVACAGDGLALRIVDLWLQHHVNDNSGHGWQRTRQRRRPSGGYSSAVPAVPIHDIRHWLSSWCPPRLTGLASGRVLSQRTRRTSRRPGASPRVRP